MKKTLIFTVIALGIAMGAIAQDIAILFQKKTFAEVKELALKENKLIFIDFYTVWCGPCKMLEKEVFPKKSVADFFNKNFINTRVDAEKGEGRELAQQYKISAYPTLLFVSADGSLAHQACGFRNAEHFVELGELALDPEKRLAKSYNVYLQGKREPPFLAQLIKDMESACLPVEKVAADYLASQKNVDLFSKANWEIFKRHIFDLDSEEFKFALKNQKKLSTLYGDSVVNEKISEVYLKKAQNIASNTTKDREKEFSNLKEEIKKANLPQKDLLLTRADLNFYSSVPDWPKFAKAATSGIIENQSRYWNNAWKLNHFAWTFYERVTDPAMLQKAVKWIRRSVELSNWPENNDTYAHLLFKLGEIDKAIEVETIALQLAIKDGEPAVEDYKKALKKFKEAKK